MIASIVTADIEFVKQPYGKDTTQLSMEMRRHLNSQKRYLANHAELLMAEIPDLVTDIDYNVVARAFSQHDSVKSDKYWKLAVESSPSFASRSMNLRGYARFMYSTGRRPEARTLYENSLLQRIGDDDRGRRNRADTYSMWALAERDFGSLAESDRLFALAIDEAKGIAAPRERDDMLSYLSSPVFSQFANFVAPPETPLNAVTAVNFEQSKP